MCNILTPLTHVNLKNRINEYEALKNDFSVFKIEFEAEKKKSRCSVIKNPIEEPSISGEPSTSGEPTTAEEY